MAPRRWVDPAVALCKHRCDDKENCAHTICCRQWKVRGVPDAATIRRDAAAAAAAAAALTAAQGTEDEANATPSDGDQSDGNPSDGNQHEQPAIETPGNIPTPVPDIQRCALFEIEATSGVATAHEIPESWASLPPEELRTIANAIERWQAVRNMVTQIRATVTAAEGFSGSRQDNDEFGEEDPNRATIDHYETCQNTLLNALQILRDHTNALIGARRPGWRDLTSGQWLRAHLDNYDADIASQTATVALLPEMRIHADHKLAERRRMARGILGPGWVGSWNVGSGGFATAHLWLKQDRGGIVRDRVVIKDTDFNLTDMLATWNDPNSWTGGGPNDVNSVPNEVQAMYNLRGKIGSETILKVRNWRVRRASQMYRTMTEYCPGGDLYNLTNNDRSTDTIVHRGTWPTINLRAPGVHEATTRMATQSLDAEQVTAVMDALRGENPPMVPEPFVWSTIEAMATAGLLMEHGELESGGLAPWDQIVHCDLKLENLFASPPHSQCYAGYPQLKLGDFGMAILLRQNDTRVPSDFLIRGTAQTMAPEQHMHTFNDTESPRMMSAATNVYGTGMIIWQMLSGIDIPMPQPVEISSPQWYRQKLFEPPALDATAQAFYTPALVDLTYSMCRHDDQARPTFRQVLNTVQRFLRGPNNPAPGLREAGANDPRYQGKYRLAVPASSADRYALGLSLEFAIPMGAFVGTLPLAPPPPGSDIDSDMADDLGGGPAIGRRPELAPPALTLNLSQSARPNEV